MTSEATKLLRGIVAAWDAQTRFDVETPVFECMNAARAYLSQAPAAEAPTQPLFSSDHEIMHGALCIAGTRIPVSAIKNLHKAGYTVDRIMSEYPDLSREHIRAAIAAPAPKAKALAERLWEQGKLCMDEKLELSDLLFEAALALANKDDEGRKLEIEHTARQPESAAPAPAEAQPRDASMRMVVCDICGNKRCPHATDHRNACTDSNESGQPGSAYAVLVEQDGTVRDLDEVCREEGVTDAAPAPADGLELPGMLAVAKGVQKQEWPHTMDARVWAEEFCKRFHPVDKRLKPAMNAAEAEGLMVAWFANSIMAGYDTANMCGGQELAASRREVAALREEIGYIVNAKRFDRESFDDDTAFADWAQNRLRAALQEGTTAGERK